MSLTVTVRAGVFLPRSIKTDFCVHNGLLPQFCWQGLLRRPLLKNHFASFGNFIENKNFKNPYTGNEPEIRIPVVPMVSFGTYKTIHGEELPPTIFSIYIINLLGARFLA